MYKNWSMNYAAYVVTELNSKEIEGAEENIQQILNYVNENLLKVTFLNIDFFHTVLGIRYFIGFYSKEYIFLLDQCILLYHEHGDCRGITNVYLLLVL